MLCQAEGCEADLAADGKYSIKRRLCKQHLAADWIFRRRNGGDMKWRFCQQCGKLQPLSMFDGSKRSCREQLAKRRQGAAPVPVKRDSSEVTSSTSSGQQAMTDTFQPAATAAAAAGTATPTAKDVAQLLAGAAPGPVLQPVPAAVVVAGVASSSAACEAEMQLRFAQEKLLLLQQQQELLLKNHFLHQQIQLIELHERQKKMRIDLPGCRTGGSTSSSSSTPGPIPPGATTTISTPTTALSTLSNRNEVLPNVLPGVLPGVPPAGHVVPGSVLIAAGCSSVGRAAAAVPVAATTAATTVDQGQPQDVNSLHQHSQGVCSGHGWITTGAGGLAASTAAAAVGTPPPVELTAASLGLAGEGGVAAEGCLRGSYQSPAAARRKHSEPRGRRSQDNPAAAAAAATALKAFSVQKPPAWQLSEPPAGPQMFLFSTGGMAGQAGKPPPAAAAAAAIPAARFGLFAAPGSPSSGVCTIPALTAAAAAAPPPQSMQMKGQMQAVGHVLSPGVAQYQQQRGSGTVVQASEMAAAGAAAEFGASQQQLGPGQDPFLCMMDMLASAESMDVTLPSTAPLAGGAPAEAGLQQQQQQQQPRQQEQHLGTAVLPAGPVATDTPLLQGGNWTAAAAAHNSGSSGSCQPVQAGPPEAAPPSWASAPPVMTPGQPPELRAAAASAQVAAAAAAAVAVGDISPSRSEGPVTMQGDSRDSFMSMIKQLPSTMTGNAASGTTFDNLSQVLAAALADHPAAAAAASGNPSTQQQQQQQPPAHTSTCAGAARGAMLRSPLELEPAWTSSRHSPQPETRQSSTSKPSAGASAAVTAAAGGSNMLMPTQRRGAAVDLQPGQSTAAQERLPDVAAGHGGHLTIRRVGEPSAPSAGAGAGAGSGLGVLPAAGGAGACPASWLPLSPQEQLSESCEGWDLGW